MAGGIFQWDVIKTAYVTKEQLMFSKQHRKRREK